MLVPILLMSLGVAVGGFVAASNVLSDVKVGDSSVSMILTILVAVFGFLILLLTILANGLDIGTKVAFHQSAAEDLRGLCEKVRVYRMERSMDEHNQEEDEELRGMFPDEVDGSDDDTVDDVNIENSEALVVRNEIKKKEKRQRHQERLAKALVMQKVRQARRDQDISKDVIVYYGFHAELQQVSARLGNLPQK